MRVSAIVFEILFKSHSAYCDSILISQTVVIVKHSLLPSTMSGEDAHLNDYFSGHICPAIVHTSVRRNFFRLNHLGIIP